MYAIELYVPKYDNQGEPIPDGHWADLENQIRIAFNGYTRFEAVGHWQGISEEIYLYRILSSGFSDNAKEAIVNIAGYVKKTWQQETVLWTASEISTAGYYV